MTINTEKLRALLAAATPRPWRSSYEPKDPQPPYDSVMPDGDWVVEAPPQGICGVIVATTTNGLDHDAALIAAAVNALPELLDALATAEAERDELRAEVTLTAADAANVRAGRLTLARALVVANYGPEHDVPSFDVTQGEYDAACEAARRIVAEADAASKEVGRG